MTKDTLTKNITRYVRKFGIKSVNLGNSFYYKDGKINYTVLSYDDDEQHIKHIENTYGIDVRPFYFLFCLMHEVGHHMTVDELTEDDMIFELIMRNGIFPLVEEDTNSAYFNLPAEDLANKWALEYILNHADECWKFQRKCFAIMSHQFKKKSFMKKAMKGE